VTAASAARGRLLAVEPGFAPERVLTARVALPRVRYASDTAQARFWAALEERLAAIPGASAAGVVSLVPLGGGMSYMGYQIVGRPSLRPNEGPMAVTYYASPGYLRAFGVPVRRGRAFTAADRLGAPTVAVVSERLARAHFPGEDPMGRRVQPFGDDGPKFEIVGVVGDVKHTSLADEERPSLYIPMAQVATSRAAVVLRASGDPAALAGAVRRAVAELDPTLAVADVQPMRRVIAQATARPRFSALLLAAFAAYGFAWMRFPGRKSMFVIVIALLVVPLQTALVPILRDFTNLNINGSYLSVWIAHTGFGLPLATYFMFNYISQLPRDIFESAFIDGAGHFTIFMRLIFPLTMPALASIGIFQFLWTWNDYLVALVFLGNQPETQVLSMRIADMVGSRGNDWHLLTAGAFVSMILPLTVFFSLQRYFVRGLLGGSVKG